MDTLAKQTWRVVDFPCAFLSCKRSLGHPFFLNITDIKFLRHQSVLVRELFMSCNEPMLQRFLVPNRNIQFLPEPSLAEEEEKRAQVGKQLTLFVDSRVLRVIQILAYYLGA